MIAYLRGRVIDIGAETLVLEVNGVGYELYCSASVFSKARFGAEIELYVSMHVKEDGITLFGFDSPKEKELFARLTSVSGVGPKSAMGVFTSMSADEAAEAIMLADVKKLSKAKGLWLTVKYPSNWLAKDGERPNIVQKFVHNDGPITELLMVQIKDVPKEAAKELPLLTALHI